MEIHGNTKGFRLFVCCVKFVFSSLLFQIPSRRGKQLINIMCTYTLKLKRESEGRRATRLQNVCITQCHSLHHFSPPTWRLSPIRTERMGYQDVEMEVNDVLPFPAFESHQNLLWLPPIQR
jgi:hypothetical protein